MYKKKVRGIRYYDMDLESTVSFVLTYYIIEKVIGSGESYYGVEIEEKKSAGKFQSVIGYNQLLLSDCKERVEEILNKLIGGGVTPITMDCVIDELVM